MFKMYYIDPNTFVKEDRIQDLIDMCQVAKNLNLKEMLIIKKRVKDKGTYGETSIPQTIDVPAPAMLTDTYSGKISKEQAIRLLESLSSHDLEIVEESFGPVIWEEGLKYTTHDVDDIKVNDNFTVTIRNRAYSPREFIILNNKGDRGNYIYYENLNSGLTYKAYVLMRLLDFITKSLIENNKKLDVDYLKSLKWTKEIGEVTSLDEASKLNKELVAKLIIQDRGSFKLILNDEVIGVREGYSSEIEIGNIDPISLEYLKEEFHFYGNECINTSSLFIRLSYLEPESYLDKDITKGRILRLSEEGIILDDENRSILRIEFDNPFPIENNTSSRPKLPQLPKIQSW